MVFLKSTLSRLLHPSSPFTSMYGFFCCTYIFRFLKISVKSEKRSMGLVELGLSICLFVCLLHVSHIEIYNLDINDFINIKWAGKSLFNQQTVQSRNSFILKLT